MVSNGSLNRIGELHRNGDVWESNGLYEGERATVIVQRGDQSARSRPSDPINLDATNKLELRLQEPPPKKPYTITFDLAHSLHGHPTKQKFDVSEGETFRAVTKVDGVRWTLEGKVGKVTDGALPVQVTYEYFKNEKNKERSTNSFKLKMTGATAGSASVHGVFLSVSAVANKPAGE